MEDFQSKYTGEQVEEYLDQIANGEVGGGDGGASVYTWEWDGNEQGSVTDEVFTSIYNSDVLYLRYAGMDIPATVARADLTLIIAASILGGDNLLTIGVTFTWLNYTAEMTTKEIGGGAADNVYITDFKVTDFIRLKEGEIEELQIDPAALSEAIIAKKTILVPYDEDYVGGYSLLLGEVADREIYFSIYTHIGQYIYAEAYDGVFFASPTIIRHLEIEPVQQMSLDTLKNIAVANAVQTDGLLYAFPDQATGEEDDVILTRGTVKTINGESILGSGDITISGGGSSSGSGAYAEVNHGTSDTTFTLTPNTFHIWDEVSALTLTLGSETSGVANEFLFQFNSGSTATTLSLPSNLKWTEELVIEPNMIYQVSILKGLASVLSWENVAELVENKLEIVRSGKSYIINSQYPVESSLKILLSNASVTSITFPAGSSSYNIGSSPTTPSISTISPSEDNTYKYIW